MAKLCATCGGSGHVRVSATSLRACPDCRGSGRAHIPDAYLETLDRMEPDIAAVDLTAAASSIAISLKRIADVVERLDGWAEVFQTALGPDTKAELLAAINKDIVAAMRKEGE